MAITITETFFSLDVADMDRATAFYVALGARVKFATPQWTSIYVADVRIGLFRDAATPPAAIARGRRTGLHFAVTDMAAAIDDVVRAGGGVVLAPHEAAPGVLIADLEDTEGNVFALRG